MILLQGHAVTLTLKVATQNVKYNTYTASIWWSFLWNVFKIRLQIRKLWTGHDLLQGHAVTLTFKVVTQMLQWHIVSIWWSFMWNSFKIRLQITKLWAGHEFGTYGRTDWRTDGLTDWRTDGQPGDYMLPRNFSGSIKMCKLLLSFKNLVIPTTYNV